MTVPLIILAVLSAVGGFLGIPHVFHMPNLLEGWLEPIFAKAMAILPQHHGEHTTLEFTLMAVSTVIAVSGILLARNIYKNGTDVAASIASRFSGLHKLLWNKYWVDEIYQMAIVSPIFMISRDFLWKVVDVILIDGLINGSARAVGAGGNILRRMQSGVAQNYALLMMLGIIVLIAIAVMPMLR